MAVASSAAWELFRVCFGFVWTGDRDGGDVDTFQGFLLLSIWMCQPT